MAEFVFADDYRLEKGPTRSYYEMFLKGLVHKNNNFMGVIQGFSSLILYDESINQEVRESAEQMQAAARGAAEMSKEVLTPGGCSSCDSGTVDLQQVAPFWKEKCEELSQSTGVRVAFTMRDGIPPVKGDSGKVGEIFGNLIKNAFEAAASVSNGSVAVDIFPPGEASKGSNVDLFIRNSSPELSTEKIREAFKPFESSKGADHFGIGLTTCAILAGDMGMRLGLRNSDGTTTAWLALPPA